VTARSGRPGGYSGLGLWILPPEQRDRPVPAPARRASNRHAGVKGKRAEREAVKLWIRAGWPGARVQPGSGSLRRYGAGDLPELPGDVTGVRPWEPVEVKWDAEATRPARGTGYLGGAFIRRTVAVNHALWLRLERVAGRPSTEPVVMIRMPAPRGQPTVMAWRVLVRSAVLLGGAAVLEADPEEYVELPAWAFFTSVAATLDEPVGGR
jgi:hypothetical protein